MNAEEYSPKKRSLPLIKAQIRYEASEAAKERMDRYNKSEKGKERKRRWAAKKLAEKKKQSMRNQDESRELPL